jgi:hypothetical protein
MATLVATSSVNSFPFMPVRSLIRIGVGGIMSESNSITTWSRNSNVTPSEKILSSMTSRKILLKVSRLVASCPLSVSSYRRWG